MVKGLTNEDAANIRAAYRDAYLAENPVTEIDKFYAKYVNLYGISLNDLRRLAVMELRELHRKDPKRKREQGRKLKSSAAKKETKPRFAVQRPDPTGLEAADVRTTGRPTPTAKRTRFVRGGLPGLGKR